MARRGANRVRVAIGLIGEVIVPVLFRTVFFGTGPAPATLKSASTGEYGPPLMPGWGGPDRGGRARRPASELAEERDEVGLLLLVELQVLDEVEQLDGVLQG